MEFNDQLILLPQVAEVATALSRTEGRVDDISQRQAHTYRELEENKQKMRELEDMVKRLNDEGGEKEKLKEKYQRRIKELEDEISSLKQTIRDADRARAMEVESLRGKMQNIKEKKDTQIEVNPNFICVNFKLMISRSCCSPCKSSSEMQTIRHALLNSHSSALKSKMHV